MMVTLVLHGTVPGKKNRLRRSRHGGIYIDQEVRTQIDSLTIQAAEQWRQREPAVHPDMTVQFYVKDRRSDLDNKITACWDILRHAGVIRNDNVKHFSGTITILPAIIDRQERVVLEISYETAGGVVRRKRA